MLHYMLFITTMPNYDSCKITLIQWLFIKNKTLNRLFTISDFK